MRNDWQPIEAAPRDGSVVLLTWMDDGEPQEIWPMQWGTFKGTGCSQEQLACG